LPFALLGGHWGGYMLRVKIIAPHKKYRVGQTVELSNNEAFGLIDSGVASVTKDMVSTNDYRIKKRG
jgi:hypothetical protein